jgi:hypothetical protein
MQIKTKLVSSLEKVFHDKEPKGYQEKLSLFIQEEQSFQVAYCVSAVESARLIVQVEAPNLDLVRVRRVVSVPLVKACYPRSDDGYLRKEVGLYPDRLEELPKCPLLVKGDTWYSLWLDVLGQEVDETTSFPVTLSFFDEKGEILAKETQDIIVYPDRLPEQTLIRTQWFHADAIADAYQVEVFSKEHWHLMENFINLAVKRGINMILTPIHTPPLDTRIGNDRLTVQLVTIDKKGDNYTFDFSLLEQWVKMCLKVGVKYFELAHLFTQWGANHAPQIVATVEGKPQKIFGWETDAASAEYRTFLEQYIPAIQEFFSKKGLQNRVIWHISDEPNQRMLESYVRAKKQVHDLLKGWKVMDALTHYEYYEQGIVEHPIVAVDFIEPFIKHQVPDLWAYYCCVQDVDVSNQFIALPSVRNRNIAMQLWRHDIQGFLHWGYNFYYSQYSDYYVNPYASTDADGWVPAGDPFQVYPGRDGQPVESIRFMVTFHAMQDLSALNYLESLIGKQKVLEMVESSIGKIAFNTCPKNCDEYIRLRNRINEEIILAARIK